MLIVAVRVPAVPPAAGLNVTVIVQVPPAAIGVVGQVLVCANSVPGSVIAVIVSGALPVLVTVTGFAALTVPVF